MLSRLDIAFLPKSKHFKISWLQAPSVVILETKKWCLSLFLLFLHLFTTKWWDQMPWSSFFKCWVLSQLFHFPLSFSSRGSLVPLHFQPYLRLLIFLPTVLIPACASSSPAFHMMYSAYKLNKQGDNIQPWRTPFPNLEPVCCSMSGSNCCFLTCIQVSQKAGKVVWYSHFFKNFPVCCDPRNQRL